MPEHGRDRIQAANLHDLLSKAAVADDILGEFKQVGDPEPFDAGLRFNLINIQIAKVLIIFRAFAR
jgi:hypothetical protein